MKLGTAPLALLAAAAAWAAPQDSPPAASTPGLVAWLSWTGCLPDDVSGRVLDGLCESPDEGVRAWASCVLGERALRSDDARERARGLELLREVVTSRPDSRIAERCRADMAGEHGLRPRSFPSMLGFLVPEEDFGEIVVIGFLGRGASSQRMADRLGSLVPLLEGEPLAFFQVRTDARSATAAGVAALPESELLQRVREEWGLRRFPLAVVVDRSQFLRFAGSDPDALARAVTQVLVDPRSRLPEVNTARVEFLPCEETRSAVSGSLLGVDWPDAPRLDVRTHRGCSLEGVSEIADRRRLAGEDGSIPNAVVWLTGPKLPPVAVPSVPAVLEIRDGRFEPNVLVVPAGGEVVVLNADACCHNIHTYARRNSSVNATVAIGAMRELTFSRPEVVRITDDIHPWMEAWIHVVDSPYAAVTDEAGRVFFDGVPPGTYDVRIGHAGIDGRPSFQLEVRRGAETRFEFLLGPPEER